MTDLFLEEGIVHFSGKSSTRIYPAINFDLVKCIKKNVYT